VDVVTHDPDLHDSRAVPFRLGEEERTEEVGNLLVDKREASPGRPREVGVETERHAPRISNEIEGSQPNERVRRPSGRAQ